MTDFKNIVDEPTVSVISVDICPFITHTTTSTIMESLRATRPIKVILPDCLRPLGLAGVDVNLDEPNSHCELGWSKTIELKKEDVKEHANILVDLIKEYNKGTLHYSIEAESEDSNLRIDICGARFGIDGKYESSLFTKEENQTLWISDIDVIPNELLVRLIEEFVALDGMKFNLVVFEERDPEEVEEDEEDEDDYEDSGDEKEDVPSNTRLVGTIKSEYIPAHIKVTLPDCLSPLGLSGPVIFTNDSICGDEDFTIARDLDSETVKANCDLILQLIRQYRIGDDVVFSLSAEINGDGNGDGNGGENSNGDTDAELSITYAEVRVYLDDDSIANFPKIDVEPMQPSTKSDYTFHLDDMTDDDIKTLLEYFFKREASEYTLAVEHEEPTHDQIREWYATNGLHSVDACVAIATAEMKSLF